MDNCKSDMAPRQCGGWSPWSWRLNNLMISARTGTQNPVSQSVNLFVKALSHRLTNHTGAISMTLENGNVPVHTCFLSSTWAKWPTQIRCSETLSLLVMPVSNPWCFPDACAGNEFNSLLTNQLSTLTSVHSNIWQSQVKWLIPLNL